MSTIGTTGHAGKFYQRLYGFSSARTFADKTWDGMVNELIVFALPVEHIQGPLSHDPHTVQRYYNAFQSPMADRQPILDHGAAGRALKTFFSQFVYARPGRDAQERDDERQLENYYNNKQHETQSYVTLCFYALRRQLTQGNPEFWLEHLEFYLRLKAACIMIHTTLTTSAAAYVYRTVPTMGRLRSEDQNHYYGELFPLMTSDIENVRLYWQIPEYTQQMLGYQGMSPGIAREKIDKYFNPDRPAWTRKSPLSISEFGLLRVTGEHDPHRFPSLTMCECCHEPLFSHTPVVATMVVVTLVCGHRLHRDCAYQWLHVRQPNELPRAPTCPVCRRNVRDF